MTDKLYRQVDGTEWSWKNLNTVCVLHVSMSPATTYHRTRPSLPIFLLPLLSFLFLPFLLSTSLPSPTLTLSPSSLPPSLSTQLCWAIGSISGAMHEEDEKRFLVTVIKVCAKIVPDPVPDPVPVPVPVPT